MPAVTMGEYEVWSVSRVKDEDDLLDVILHDVDGKAVTLRVESHRAPCIASVVTLSWTERP